VLKAMQVIEYESLFHGILIAPINSMCMYRWWQMHYLISGGFFPRLVAWGSQPAWHSVSGVESFYRGNITAHRL
jgi:hypothetical protein